MSLKGGGKSAAEMQQEWLEGMSMSFACAFCESWTFEGGLLEGRLKADEHRASAHPEIPPYRRRRRKSAPMRSKWRADLSDEEREEVDAERRRRAGLLGVDIET